MVERSDRPSAIGGDATGDRARFAVVHRQANGTVAIDRDARRAFDGTRTKHEGLFFRAGATHCRKRAEVARSPRLAADYPESRLQERRAGTSRGGLEAIDRVSRLADYGAAWSADRGSRSARREADSGSDG